MTIRSPSKPAHRARLALRLLFSTVFALLVLSLAPRAEAYPWMIRHDYSGCAVCHFDPSGGFLLTEYGRAQSDLLLRTRYGKQDKPEEAEPSKTSGFLWGAVKEPEWLLMGGSFRGLGIFSASKTAGSPAATDFRYIQMQADLRAGIKAKAFRAGGSLGFQHQGALGALVTHHQNSTGEYQINLLSREHWLGLSFLDDQLLLRAGRINVPFGLRHIEHTMWVRKATRTDINASQQDGVALAYSGSSVRAELMALLGNYQINPDAYRERGYSGYVEWSPVTGWAFGASSLVAQTLLDLQTRVTQVRQAHGLFLRGSTPWKPLVLMAEGDVLLRTPALESTIPGFATMLQADIEPVQGLHVFGTFELYDQGGTGYAPSEGGWLSLQWFFLPHADMRLDGIVQNVVAPGTSTQVYTLLTQYHVFL